MKKKFIAAILTAALALGTLTACGGSGDSAVSAPDDAAETEAESTSETALSPHLCRPVLSESICTISSVPIVHNF